MQQTQSKISIHLKSCFWPPNKREFDFHSALSSVLVANQLLGEISDYRCEMLQSLTLSTHVIIVSGFITKSAPSDIIQSFNLLVI